jgi:hypothetical protein
VSRAENSPRIESPALWFLVNSVIYIALVFASFVVYILLLTNWQPSATTVGVNLVLSLPAIAIFMLLPTGVVLAILWNVGMRSVWRYRLLAAALLVVSAPAGWWLLNTTPDWLAYVVATQLVFAAVLLVSPKQSHP